MTTTRKLNRQRKKSKTRKRRVMKGGSIYYRQASSWGKGKDLDGKRNSSGYADVNKYSAIFFNKVMPLIFDFTPNNCDDFVNFFVENYNITETQIKGNKADGLAKASSRENIENKWKPLIKERVGEYIKEIKEQKDIIEEYKKTIRDVKNRIQYKTGLTVTEVGEYPDRKLIELYNSVYEDNEGEKIEFSELFQKREIAINIILDKLNILLILDQNIKEQIDSRTKAIDHWDGENDSRSVSQDDQARASIIKLHHENYRKTIKTIDDDISSKIGNEMSYIIEHIFKYNIHEFWNTFKNDTKNLEMIRVDDDDDDDGDDGNGDGENNALRDYYLFILENKKMKDLKRELMEIINKEETKETKETEEKINQITNNINESIKLSKEYYNNFIKYINLKDEEEKIQSVESISNNRNGWNNIKKMLEAAFVRNFENIVLNELMKFDETAGQTTVDYLYEQKQRKLKCEQEQEQKQKKEREDVEKLKNLRKRGIDPRLKMMTAFATTAAVEKAPAAEEEPVAKGAPAAPPAPSAQQQTCPQGWEKEVGFDDICFKWYNHPNVADKKQTQAAELIKEHLHQKYSINPSDVIITTGQLQCKLGFKIGIKNLNFDIPELSEKFTKILNENNIPVLERQCQKKDNGCKTLINLFFPRKENDEESIGKLLKKMAPKKKFEKIRIFLENQNVGKCKLTKHEIHIFFTILEHLNEIYNPGETKSEKGTELLSHLSSENEKNIFLKVKAIVDFVSYYPQGLQGGNKKRKIKTKKRKIFRQRKKKPKTRKIDRYKKTIKTK